MGTTAEKLNYLKETKSEIKNALETPYNVMRDYPALIKKYIDNQPTQVVADGVCKNALDVPLVSMGVDGNSEQKQYSGKNKFYYKQRSSSNNGITYTEQEDKSSMLLNGTSTSNSLKWIITDTDKIYLSKGTYYLACCGTTDSNVYVGLGGKNSNKELLFSITNKGTNVKFTITEDAYLHSYIDVLNDVTVNNKLVKIMIVKDGEDTNTYEPYVGGQPSPNPEYPQEITNVGENGIKIKQSGKNKVDFINYAEKVFDSSKVEKLSDGSYKFKHCDTVYTLFEGLLKAPCTLSWYARNDGTTTSNGTTFNFKIFYEDGTTEKLIYTTSPDFSLQARILTKNVIKIVNSYIGVTPLTIIKDVQLEEGSKATPYEPYHEPIITPINLQGNILSKVGDVKDVLKINRNGEVEIKKNIGKVVLTGEEVLRDVSSTSIRKWWAIDFRDYGIYQYNDPTKVCDVLTTKFKSRPQQGTFLPGQMDLTTNSKKIYFVFEPNTTEEQARAILKDMPVYFRLAEPQTIKLSSISPIELWQGTNIFSLITNLDTTFEMEYVVNKDYLETQNLLNAVEGENI